MLTDPSTASIARLRGEFSCPATEIGFLHAHAGVILRYLRRALVLSALFYLLFGINDIVVLGTQAAAGPLLSRLLMLVLAFTMLRRVYRSARPVRSAYRAATLFSICWLISYLIVTWHRPMDMMSHGMSMVIIVMVIHIFIPNRSFTSLAIAAAGSLAFLGLAWYQHSESTRHLAAMSMLVLFANVFGVMAGNRYARLWREQYRVQQVLTKLSIRDPLTGCFNRRHLNAGLLDGDLAQARRQRLGLSLIMCDLDGFKGINDSHGHHAGDELLRSFGALLQAMTRESVDTVVRYGGEEFLLILPGTDLDGARELAERIRAAFAAQRLDCDGKVLATTASFGVVGVDFGTGQAIAPQALIAAADELMYDAKRGGRDQVRARQLVFAAQ